MNTAVNEREARELLTVGVDVGGTKTHLALSTGEERVVPQAGDFYGGWITANLRGPFKGAPGTRHW